LFTSLRLPDAFAKHLVLIRIDETNVATRLEISINGKRERLTNYRLPREGTFVIEIEGTVVLEAPQAAGQ
jgi:hypothetical protein